MTNSIKAVTERREPKPLVEAKAGLTAPGVFDDGGGVEGTVLVPSGQRPPRQAGGDTLKGRINHHGVFEFLSTSPEWQGVLAWDEFSQGIVCRREPPFKRQKGAWTDTDDTLTTMWLQCRGGDVVIETVSKCVEVIARNSPFHPVKDWLNSLQWDGTPRINTWLTDYLGVAPTDLNREIARRFLIGAVARIFDPGCQNDHALILEGSQGAGKSSVTRILFGPWTDDELGDIGSKDTAMRLRGIWCIELAELDALNRKESTSIKAFLTRRIDRYRPPYGKREIEVPRQCVFIGTTNREDYLSDSTGNRRFWTVKTFPVVNGRFDLSGLQNVREQLWAEAVQARAGEQWHITDDRLQAEMMEAQADRVAEDVWGLDVLSYAQVMVKVTVQQILGHLGIPVERQDQKSTRRVTEILKGAGWVHLARQREGGNRVNYWTKANS